MPRTIKNKIETQFKADDRFSRSLGVMSRGMQRFNRIAKRAKRVLMATARAAMFLGRGAARIARNGLIAMSGAAIGVFVAVNKLAGGMDELAKTTRAIDFDIEKFQEFRFVAEQTGVDGEKFGTIVKKFSATVGEFKGGYGTMFTALKRLDPQLARQLKRTSDTSEAFELYLGAINRAPTAQKKAALASAAFGKRMGIDMINMANLSSGELEKLRAQMRRNGVVTDEQASKAEAFNDAMNRLKLTGKGLAIDALAPLMPLLENGADRMREWIIENRGMIKQKVHESFTKIISVGKKIISFLRTNIPPLVEHLKKIGSEGFAWVKENKTEIKSFFELIKSAGKILIKVAGFAIRNKEAVIAMAVAYKGLGVAMGLLNWSGFVSGAGGATTAIGTLTAKTKGLAGVVGKGGLLFTALAAGWGVGSFIFNEWNTAMDNLLTRAQNVSSKIGMTAHKMTNKELDSSLRSEGSKQREQDSIWSGARALLTGRFGERDEARTASRQSQIDILSEKLSRMRMPTPGAQSMNFSVQEVNNASIDMPQAQVSRSESVKKEVVELVIRDESGRAEVRGGGNFNGLKLATTGAR